MTYEETKKFMKRIKSHHQEFIVDDTEKIKEWYRILKDYDNDEVNEKLDDHIASDNPQIPQLKFLIRYLTRISDKGKLIDFYTNCKFCGKQFKTNLMMQNVKEHENRCRSIRYLKFVYKKYMNREIENIDALYNMSNDKFESNYKQVLQILLTKEIGEKERKCILEYLKNGGNI